MTFDEYLKALQQRLHGDGYLNLLRSSLADGSEILKVSFVPSEGGKPDRYRFLLARLGTLTDVDVPAGTQAIERFFEEKRLRLETVEQEVQRSALRFRRAVAERAKGKSPDELRAAFARFAQQAGAPESLAASEAAQNGMLTGDILRLAEELGRAFDEQVASVYLHGGYSLEEAGEIVDRGLAEFIQSRGSASEPG